MRARSRLRFWVCVRVCECGSECVTLCGCRDAPPLPMMYCKAYYARRRAEWPVTEAASATRRRSACLPSTTRRLVESPAAAQCAARVAVLALLALTLSGGTSRRSKVPPGLARAAGCGAAARHAARIRSHPAGGACLPGRERPGEKPLPSVAAAAAGRALAPACRASRARAAARAGPPRGTRLVARGAAHARCRLAHHAGGRHRRGCCGEARSPHLAARDHMPRRRCSAWRDGAAACARAPPWYVGAPRRLAPRSAADGTQPGAAAKALA